MLTIKEPIKAKNIAAHFRFVKTSFKKIEAKIIIKIVES
jgi:hypothetical protein